MFRFLKNEPVRKKFNNHRLDVLWASVRPLNNPHQLAKLRYKDQTGIYEPFKNQLASFSLHSLSLLIFYQYGFFEV